MKKRLIVMIIVLVAFNGAAWAQGKFSLKTKYEKTSVKTEMKKPAVIELWISPYDNLLYSKRTMEALNTETFERFYLQASYSFLNRFKIYGKIGVLTAESTFQNPATRYLTGYGDEIWEQSRLFVHEDNILQATSKIGFMGGAGVNFLIFEKEGFGINLDLSFLYQWVDTEIMIEEEHRKYSYFYEERVTSGWDKEIKIDKVKTQEFRIALPISKRKGNVIITAGAELILGKYEYQGLFSYKYFTTFAVHTEWNNDGEEKYDISFETWNMKDLNGFAQIEYLFKNIGILVRVVTGAETGFTVGWNWSFNL